MRLYFYLFNSILLTLSLLLFLSIHEESFTCICRFLLSLQATSEEAKQEKSMLRGYVERMFRTTYIDCHWIFLFFFFYQFIVFLSSLLYMTFALMRVQHRMQLPFPNMQISITLYYIH